MRNVRFVILTQVYSRIAFFFRHTQTQLANNFNDIVVEYYYTVINSNYIQSVLKIKSNIIMTFKKVFWYFGL